MPRFSRNLLDSERPAPTSPTLVGSVQRGEQGSLPQIGYTAIGSYVILCHRRRVYAMLSAPGHELPGVAVVASEGRRARVAVRNMQSQERVESCHYIGCGRRLVLSGGQCCSGHDVPLLQDYAFWSTIRAVRAKGNVCLLCLQFPDIVNSL